MGITQETAQALLEVLEEILSPAGFEPSPYEEGRELEIRANAIVLKAKEESK